MLLLAILLCCWLTDLLAVASSYPEPADAKLTPAVLSCPGFNIGSRKPGMLLAMPSFSAAKPHNQQLQGWGHASSRASRSIIPRMSVMRRPLLKRPDPPLSHRTRAWWSSRWPWCNWSPLVKLVVLAPGFQVLLELLPLLTILHSLSVVGIWAAQTLDRVHPAAAEAQAGVDHCPVALPAVVVRAAPLLIVVVVVVVVVVIAMLCRLLLIVVAMATAAGCLCKSAFDSVSRFCSDLPGY
ncbi:hypothetical protein U9M48_025979, partial [Paspalum notatum var. saurae]